VWQGLLVGRGKRRRTPQAESDLPPACPVPATDQNADSSTQASAALQARLTSEPCHTEQGHARPRVDLQAVYLSSETGEAHSEARFRRASGTANTVSRATSRATPVVGNRHGAT